MSQVESSNFKVVLLIVWWDSVSDPERFDPYPIFPADADPDPNFFSKGKS